MCPPDSRSPTAGSRRWAWITATRRSTTTTLFVSDEHVTFRPVHPPHVGDRVRVWPAHVDPTVAYHERMYLVAGEEVVDEWAVDLRGW